MRPSRLRHRITIQHRVSGRDNETGEVTHSWVDLYAKVPAAIEPVSGRDFIAAKAEQSEISARIVIRYKDGINSGMRVIFRNSIYTLEAPPLTDQKSGLEYLTLLCSHGAKDG